MVLKTHQVVEYASDSLLMDGSVGGGLYCLKSCLLIASELLKQWPQFMSGVPKDVMKLVEISCFRCARCARHA